MSKLFDREELSLKKLEERESKTDILVDNSYEDISYTKEEEESFSEVLDLMSKRFVILSFGAHLIKNKLSPLIIDLMRRGYINHLLSNGAAAIHDWEFAYHGVTEEDVKENMRSGSFGMWEETGYYVNEAISYRPEYGAGKSIGQWMQKENLSNKELSISWNANQMRIPFSISIGMGHDIIHMHPSCDGADLGKASHNDFLKLAYSLKSVEEVLILNVGSAVFGPMVIEKATSMARNASDFNKQRCVINDIFEVNHSWIDEDIPDKSNVEYYNRQLKTFSRIDEDFIYIRMDNRKFIYRLYKEFCL